jgi:hypothetical protein
MPRASAQIRLSPRGFNLIEAAIVLGVIGLVVGGIWVAASTVNQNLKINALFRGSLAVIANMQNLFNGFALPMGGAARSDALWSAGAYPQDAFYQRGTGVLSIFHELPDKEAFFPSPYAVTYTQGAPVTTYRYALLLSQIDKTACINMLTRLGGLNLEQLGIVRVTTSTITVYDTTVASPDTAINLSEAGSACATVTDRSQFWIFFK